MKRIVTVQDISCVGKCSLTVALPTISAMGVEACILPTAVLSTHTMWSDFTFRDLTQDIDPIFRHWKRQGFTFDALYTGFLGSFEQIDLMKRMVEEFGQDSLRVIDPCMADHGRFYPGFDERYAQAMKGLCSLADIIVPNLTEAAFLLGEEYRSIGYTVEEIRDMLLRLAAIGARKVVLKGIRFDSPQPGLGDVTGQMGVMAYDSESGEFSHYFHECLPENFHGTGDIYASVLTGGLMRGLTLKQAYSLAADFVVQAIKATLSHEDHNIYGVDFESVIPWLVRRVEELA